MLGLLLKPVESRLATTLASTKHEPFSPEADHPLVNIRHIVDEVCGMHSSSLRMVEPGLPCARLIRAALLQGLYAFSCNQQLMEQLRYNALYRWFVGLDDDDAGWDAETYVHALAELRTSKEYGPLFHATLQQAHAFACLMPGRFRLDSALLQAWTRQTGRFEEMGFDPATPVAGKDDMALARLERARTVIVYRIGDPSLSPDKVADELCMSRRALYVLFQKHGMTPSKAILEIRLDICRKALGETYNLHRKVTDIAMDCGFTHPASFSRQFKARYGLSPRDARPDRPETGGGAERVARYRASTHGKSISP